MNRSASRPRAAIIWVLAILVHVLPGRQACAVTVQDLLKWDDAVLLSPAGRSTIEHTRLWQNPDGGWPKDYDPTQPPPADRSQVAWAGISTFDDYATTAEVRLLVRVADLTEDREMLEAARRGLRFILLAQGGHGGWPQRYPPPRNYGRHITFNDDAMTHVLSVLLDARRGQDGFARLDPALRRDCGEALDRGVACVLRCQVLVDGQPTVWAAQHEAQTLVPAQGRAYEPAALASHESAGVLLLLMRLPDPDPGVIRAIKAGQAWLDQAALSDRNKVAVGGGPELAQLGDPVWARFYDAHTGRPVFGDRDGSRHESLKAISAERREGYAWFSTRGRVVQAAYPVWRQRLEEAAAKE